MFENIRKTVEAKKESYEASAGMVACLALAALFAMGAAVIWLSYYVGPIFAALSFSGAFLLLALCLKLVSSAKNQQASESLEAVQESANAAVETVSATAKTAASVPTKPSVLFPALVFAAVLLIIFDRSASPQAVAWEDQ